MGRACRLPTVDRYVAITVAQSFAFALAALVAVFSVINATEELQRVRGGQYGVREALWFVLLTLPNEAYALFPAAAVLGNAIGLGGLAHRNEILALASAGLSRGRIVWSALRIALGLVVLGTAMHELVAAPLTYRARTERANALSDGRLLVAGGGVWARAGSRYVNLRTVLPDGEAQDVSVYEFDGARRLHYVGQARSATYGDGHWLLHDVVEMTIGEDGTHTEWTATQPLAIELTPRQLGAMRIPPAELSLAELARSIAAARRQGAAAERFELAWWQRATMPLVVAAMSFLAVALILSATRVPTLGRRIFVGTLIGVGFQMLNQTFAGAGLVYGAPPWASATVPALLALAGGAWCLTRSRL